MTFEEQLELGHVGERLVVGHLKSRLCGVIPSYEYAGADGQKAPRLMFADNGLVIPDLDVCKLGRRFWAEVKTYYHAPENRREKCRVHGVPRRLYLDYFDVEYATGCPVFIMVLEVSTGALLSARLKTLRVFLCQCGCEGDEARRCKAQIRNGIYWNRDHMKLAHQFGDNDMADLRSRWPVPRSAA